MLENLALSRRTQLTRPNGVNTNYTYDTVSRLLSVLHQVGSVTVDGASYSYDPAGNRLSKTDLLASVTSNYSYDPLYELTGVSQGTGTTESYTYDAVGNRLSSLGVSPYTYNSSNQLTSLPSGSYTYDRNGSTLTKPDGTSYTWDYENRLKQVTLPGTAGTVTFKYDPFGRRVQKAFTQGGTTTATNYLYDGMNLLEELDASGNVLARYTHSAHDPDELEDEPLAQLRSGTTSYYQQDGINGITSLTNPAGALANSYTYDAFGKLTASSGTLVNPFQYAGRQFDQETGIYNYRMRYYDPNVGRFLSEDPLGFNGGDSNFYAYVLNSPTGLVDPLGLQHQPGGPQHPAPGVGFRCQGGPNRTQGDSCDVIMAKMALIAYYLADHALWDMQHGGNRHASDINNLAGAFRRCLEMFNKWCVGKCKDKPPDPPKPPIDPWTIPIIPRIPGPLPFIIDPCLLNPHASYCHSGPAA